MSTMTTRLAPGKGKVRERELRRLTSKYSLVSLKKSRTGYAPLNVSRGMTMLKTLS